MDNTTNKTAQLRKEAEEKIQKIALQIEAYKQRGLKIFATSSFQTHSLPLLHLLSRIDNSIPVYFLNTGFHFPETYQFKNHVADEFNITVIDVESPVSKASQRDGNNNFYFISNPDYCCYLNKVLPIEPVLLEKDVWISGVRKSQNNNRSSFSFEAEGKHNTLRYHPVLDWTDQHIWTYIATHDLPKHPLDTQGYLSIGCEPCTHKFDPEKMGMDRESRWIGLKKNECGLHTDLIKK